MQYLSRALLVLILSFSSGAAYAQSSYQSHLLGLRTSGMGGAAIAFGHDSAMPWQNPAGTALAQESEFGVAANSLVAGDVRVNQYFGASEEYRRTRGILPQDINSTISNFSVNVFPSSAAFSFPMDEKRNHHFTLSVIVPYAQLDDELTEMVWDAGGGMSVDQKRTEVTRLTFFDFGSSYAARLSETFRLGFSAFVRYAPYDQTGGSTFLLHQRNTREIEASSEEYFTSASSYDLDLAVGTQIGPFGGFSIGVAAHAPSLHLGGSLEERIREYCSRCDSDEVVKVTDYTADGSFEMRTPAWFGLGLGYEIPQTFAIAADATVWLPVDEYDQSLSDGEFRTVQGDPALPIDLTPFVELASTADPRELVVNVNVGAEYYINERIILRGGFFTNFSNVPALIAEEERTKSDVGTRRIDMLGGSLGVAYQGPSTQFQLGLIYMGGLGEIIGLELDSGPTLYPTREIASNTFMLTFSGEIDAAEILSSAQAAFFEEYQVQTREETSGGSHDVQ